jgi:hypothetical protein
MTVLPEPHAGNGYLAEHIGLLRRSLRLWAGRDLIASDLPPVEAARRIFDAPFVVLSHGPEADPILTYGNRAALELFDLSWAEL